jgi:sugar O-acyltransferase (sialic acid O-acetyltransferase NeuD family)
MSVVVIGAGGQAKVLLELMDRAGIGPVSGIIDGNPELVGKKIDGIAVLGSMEKLANVAKVYRMHRAVIAIGDNATRARLAEQVRAIGLRLPVLIHPNACVSPNATLGDGTVVMAGAVINTHAKVGELGIINTRASVDHDCELGDNVHIAPGVTLCGNVTIGDNTLIGVGASVIPGIIIGSHSIVGAGATVVRDVPSYTTVVGCPAREIPHKGTPRPEEPANSNAQGGPTGAPPA